MVTTVCRPVARGIVMHEVVVERVREISEEKERENRKQHTEKTHGRLHPIG
jgi:hypothetical protein